METIEIYLKLNRIENELMGLKVLLMKSYSVPKHHVSFRGIGKAIVSEEELDKSINEAKKSLFKNVLCD
ncbi:hypothetical protein BEH94_01795 [Candidatus Altiarchaeales archaeon WOR_SM1_SCG]|nr:hypothetical protein BEH94_01795 [Candidatus Altiarchaeales archaeon WOR_SM1_SCG]